MIINLKNGIDKLLFGMKQSDVTAIYGKPDRNYKDEDDNVIFVYNAHKIRLTFYEEEDLIARAIRDFYSKDIDRIIVDGDKAFEAAKKYAKKISSAHSKNVVKYKGKIPIFHHYNIEKYLNSKKIDFFILIGFILLFFLIKLINLLLLFSCESSLSHRS